MAPVRVIRVKWKKTGLKHLLQCEHQLSAPDRLCGGFRNICLDKAEYGVVDTYTLTENVGCLLAFWLRWQKEDFASLTCNGKILGGQNKEIKFSTEVFSNNFAYIFSARLNSLIYTILSNAYFSPQ